MSSSDISLDTVQLDLAGDFEAVLDRPCDLVTISALLDLVSETGWIGLPVRCRSAALPVYAALTYDGRIGFAARPGGCGDHRRRECPSAHRQGVWAGARPCRAPLPPFPGSRSLAIGCVHGTSDWTIGAADQAMQIELLDGWAAAAREMNALPGLKSMSG